ncbi:MAG: peptidoglycan-binding protein [Aureispira sp.]|nr:peptidoglycan-binding protein [Aureispira sp.]
MKRLSTPLRLTLTLIMLMQFQYNYAQSSNIDHLLNIVETGKTYTLSKAKKSGENTLKETESYYIKLVPPVYETVLDTIVLSPALNGNLDTSNYFIQTEVLVLREPGASWKTAKISAVCMNEEGAVPYAGICLLKTVPKYSIVHRKFFPFKNILDTTTTDYVIPAKITVVERRILKEKAQLVRINGKDKPSVKSGEKLIKISAGTWYKWAEVVCPFGQFNDPKISDVQAALKKEGYAVKITGDYDEQTKRGIHDFQKDHVLEVGELSEETIQRLGVKRERLITIQN